MKRILLTALLAAYTLPATASAWLEPDDIALRHDLQLLSDYGLLKIPTSSWPIRWQNIQGALAPLPDNAVPIMQSAYRRLQQALAVQRNKQGRLATTLEATAATGRPLLQGFGQTQRNDSSARVALEGSSSRVEGRLAFAVTNPGPPAPHQFDHSYLGINLGNWNVDVDMLDRWWGPGWDGSLILSNNPYPLPTLSFQRNSTVPFNNRLLSWLGPWDLNVRFGQFEQQRPIPRVQFFAARLVFQPAAGLELGLSRAAQWGGHGRANTVQAFIDMLLGHDNAGDNIAPAKQPGNQLGGYDARLRLPRLPVALYGQLIGEDESVMLPTAKMLLYGIEGWGALGSSSYRLYFEYADTATYRDIDNRQPGYNTAYNGFFPDGYRYFGDTLGHSADGDSMIRSLGLVTIHPNGWSSHLLYRNGDINRDNAGQNLLSNNMKTSLEEWTVRMDKHWEGMEAFVQFGDSRRTTATEMSRERSLGCGITINL